MPSDKYISTKLSLFDFCLFSIFGIGKIPWAPGTMASIFTALIIYFLLSLQLHWMFYLLITVFIFIISFFRLNLRQYKNLVEQDPGWIVIDEFLGMFFGAIFLVYLNLLNPTTLIIFLLFFRFFDIKKIFPANIFNEKKGAFPLIADDLISGFYAFVGVFIVHKFIDF